MQKDKYVPSNNSLARFVMRPSPLFGEDSVFFIIPTFQSLDGFEASSTSFLLVSYEAAVPEFDVLLTYCFACTGHKSSN